MTRSDVDAGMQHALKQPVSTILPLVELDIQDDQNTPQDEGPVHAWGGIGDLSWDGKIWKGVGNMGEIGPIQADEKGSIPSLELSLLGLDADMLSAATRLLYRGKSGRVWLACFDENMVMQGEPALYFAGEISNMSLVDGTEKRIRVTLDSRMAILKKNKPRYRTDEDQQRRHNGDLFFNFVASVSSKTVYWGLSAPSRGRTTSTIIDGGSTVLEGSSRGHP